MIFTVSGFHVPYKPQIELLTQEQLTQKCKKITPASVRKGNRKIRGPQSSGVSLDYLEKAFRS